MFLSTVAKYIQLSLSLIKLNILSAMEYRTAFWIQIVGMIINDTCIVGVWYIMFLAFPEINGWHFSDMITLFALTMTQYGLLGIFAGGFNRIARTITSGALDHYLALPKPALWQILLSKTDISAIGDFIFGCTLFILFGIPTLSSITAFVALSFLTGAILLNCFITLHSIAFYATNFEEVVYQYTGIMNGFSFAPQSVFHGSIKWIMFTIFPAIFTVTFPVTITYQWQWTTFLYILAFWLLTLILALTLFHFGLRRYESGNLIQHHD